MLAEVRFEIFPLRKADFLMEEISKMQKIKGFFIRYLPYILSGIVVLCIGLSMIGPFFDLRVKIDGEKIDTVYRLTDLLFTSNAGKSTQVFSILTYLGLPLLGCGFVFLGKLNHNFYTISVLLFLVAGMSSILVNDITATVVSLMTELNYSVHDVYFCFVLPIIIFFIAGFVSLAIASKEINITVSDITEMGILIGLALALNFVKIVQMPTGGSINFQMLPLFILALRKGPIKGFIGAGIAYGLISCITDGYGIATYPFDYMLGFGSVCVLGFFTPFIFGEDQKNYNFKGELFIIIGAFISTFIRFIGGTVSSMIIYGYDLLPAMTYNSLYVSISGLIAIVVVMAVYGPFIRVNNRFPSNKK